MTIISLSGLIGSGKDTVADYLVSKYGFKRDSFASTLKDACAAIFGWDREMLEGKTEGARERREVVDQWWADRLNIQTLSPRWVLQHFGTDTCRRHFHNDIWLASLENKLRLAKTENVVISDARFLNELDMLADAGAKTVCVSRGEKPDWWKIAANPETRSRMEIRSSPHPSEWDWAVYKFDTDIDNNGSLTDLYSTVDNLLKVWG
jgi:hypothetical protein